MSSGTNASFSAALAHHQAGRLDAARTGYRETLTRDPDHAESLHLLGLIMAQTGDPAAGAESIERAISLAPGRAPHHNSLALAYRGLLRDADAVREYRVAAELRPGSAEIHNNLATTLRAMGRQAEAVAEYRRAVTFAPEIAEIWYNLASTLADPGPAAHKGPVAEAEACFRRAITLRPDYVDALANYGSWLTAQTRWIEGEVQLSEAVRLTPNDARTRNNLGVARQELGNTARAEADYRRAIALDPDFADAHYNLGCLLFGEGRSDDAVRCHAAALAADRLHGAARLALCMARLPIVYQTQMEVAIRRADYLAALSGLAEAVEEPAVARAVAAAIGTSQPFFLPYQGENDLEPQACYGRLVCRLLAEAEPPPAPIPRPAGRERIRLGIVSGFFQDHTIFQLFLEGWLSELDRDRFEVTAFHTGRMCDAETARAAASCDRFVHGLASAGAWTRAVSDAAPHVLLYPEVGIDPVCGRLAAQRLAQVQCVAWGQPETTGMPTMDYFLSADLMEPADGEAHYTERLVRLPDLGLHYTPDERAIPASGRQALGLDPTAPVYWSGQALYKYLPEYDAVFPRIAAVVGRCQFVFIGYAKSAAVTAMFQKRLERAFAEFGLDADRYCVMLPPMPQDRFVAAMGLADVVLDTPGWSGGKSTLDCLARNPAIVTLPGRFMRGRHTAAILRRIECEATIARTLEDYVAIAARLGLDAAWRVRVRRDVASGKHRAFRDTGVVRALETFLTRAVAAS
jgi:protein O-GlcNAc transferase